MKSLWAAIQGLLCSRRPLVRVQKASSKKLLLTVPLFNASTFGPKRKMWTRTWPCLLYFLFPLPSLTSRGFQWQPQQQAPEETCRTGVKIFSQNLDNKRSRIIKGCGSISTLTRMTCTSVGYDCFSPFGLGSTVSSSIKLHCSWNKSVFPPTPGADQWSQYLDLDSSSHTVCWHTFTSSLIPKDILRYRGDPKKNVLQWSLTRSADSDTAYFAMFGTLGYIREHIEFEGLLPRLMPQSNLKFCMFSIT